MNTKPASNNPHSVLQGLPNNAVVCLMAPTASGKTALAYELYDTGRFEIISVDSALIYRDMMIGTAKPTPDELARYPHHMVDIVNPDDSYSVASFISQVEMLITLIHERGRIPLLVGGTMMYYMAMFEGLSPVPETDFDIRAEVEGWRQQVGVEALHAYLREVDPVIAERLNATDTQRITRAVEVYKQTGKPLSQWQQLPKNALADNPEQYWLGLTVQPDRPWLHKRIAKRLDIMWNDGFLAEVIVLVNTYSLSADDASMRCVGYRQVLDYLHDSQYVTINKTDKRITPTVPVTDPIAVADMAARIEVQAILGHDPAFQDMKDKALYATRQLAKRQYTWLRNLNARYHIDPNKLKDSAESNKEIHAFNEIESAQSFILRRVLNSYNCI